MRNSAAMFQVLLSVLMYDVCNCIAINEPKTSIFNVEKTLGLVLDFIHKTKDSNIYQVLDFSQRENLKENSGDECGILPSSCAELQLLGYKESGIYQIYPRGFKLAKPFDVYCDLITDGGGWTVFQRRDDFGEPRENFFRTWNDYKMGFGNLSLEFWLGNDYLHLLTSQDRMIMRVDLEDFEKNAGYAVYTNFYIAEESFLYKMTFDKYSGTAGDSLSYHNKRKFSTKDKDNYGMCARQDKGGWWYGSCHESNLNGMYFTEYMKPNRTCTNWKHLKKDRRCMKRTEMKLRPSYFVPQEEPLKLSSDLLQKTNGNS